jgi:hypothetical protein
MISVITNEPSFVVVCRSGGDYTLEHAACLHRQFQAFNTDKRFQFWCLTDTPTEPWHIRLETDWPGWWAVQEAWRFTGPTILTGLDTLFARQLTPFTALALACPPDMVWGTRDFYRPNEWANAVMVWNGDHRQVTEGMEPELRKSEMGHTATRLAAMGVRLGLLDDVLDGILSYKKHVHVAGSASSEANARLVAWHGMPRPWHDKCAGTWAGRMYRSFMEGGDAAAYQLLAPSSTSHKTTQFHFAWTALGDEAASLSRRMNAKCWLTYRAVDGEITFADWLACVAPAVAAPHEETPLGVRWRVSQLTGEAYLMILNGRLDEARLRMIEVNDIVFAGGSDLWPPCVLNWLRCAVLNQYALHLEGVNIADSAARVVENWRGMAHKYDWHKWPMRVDEMIHDIRALNVLAAITHKREKAFWLAPKNLVGNKEIFHRCLLKLGEGNPKAIFT